MDEPIIDLHSDDYFMREALRQAERETADSDSARRREKSQDTHPGRGLFIARFKDGREDHG